MCLVKNGKTLKQCQKEYLDYRKNIVGMTAWEFVDFIKQNNWEDDLEEDIDYDDPYQSYLVQLGNFDLFVDVVKNSAKVAERVIFYANENGVEKSFDLYWNGNRWIETSDDDCDVIFDSYGHLF